MSSKQTRTTLLEKGSAAVEKGFTKAGNGLGSVLGRPNEQDVETTSAAGSNSPQKLLTDLQLPLRVAKILENPLEKLDLRLESENALHEKINKMIDYHVIRTAKGKIVLTFFGKDALGEGVVEDVWLHRTFSSLGFMFNRKSIALFVLSDATIVGNDYHISITEWCENLRFEAVELLLEDRIRQLEESDFDVRVVRIRKLFGLTEETGTADGPDEKVSFDRARFREMVTENFNLDEIRTLCADLKDTHKLNYDELQGGTLTQKIISLVEHFEKGGSGSLPDLFRYLKQQRPSAGWEAIAGWPDSV